MNHYTPQSAKTHQLRRLAAAARQQARKDLTPPADAVEALERTYIAEMLDSRDMRLREAVVERLMRD